MRRTAYRMMVKSLMEAMDNDMYPSEDLEGVFGIRMESSSSNYDVSSMPIGSLVFCGWTTIKKMEMELRVARIIPNYCPYTFGDKKQMDVAMKQAKDELSAEIVAALMDGTLPQWFAKKITYLNNDALQPGGALSHNYGPNSYLAELVRRNFAGITWDPLPIYKEKK